MDAKRANAFSMIELLAVIAIFAVTLALVCPTLNSMLSAGDVTRSAYQTAGALETARAYAIANHTYVWVGFFEEDGARASTSPATTGIGRIVMSTVASRDGTAIYETNPENPATLIDPARLIQVNELARIERMHLKNFSPGAGGGETFDSRPLVSSSWAKIGDIFPPEPSATPIQYPLGSFAPQYIFWKAIQFSPAGEMRVNNTYYKRPLMPLVEIGLQPMRGNHFDDKNVVVIQVSGLMGNVRIYRK